MAEEESSTLGSNIVKKDFDVPSAMSEGYTSSDIAKYLSEQSGIDYDEALRGGYDDDSLIMGLATKDGEDYTDPSAFTVFSDAAAKGLLQSVPAFEGGKMGFQIGMKLPGPLKLFTPITTAAGVASGYIFGDNLSELFNFEDNVVPSKMPYKVTGESFGGGLGFYQAPFRAAQTVQPGTFAWMKQNAKDMGDKISPTFLEKLGYSAQVSPKTTLVAEGTSIVGASIAGGLSEKADPGDNFNRLIAEVVGGTAGPAAYMSLIPAIKSGTKNLFSYLSASGRQDIAGTQLKRIIEESGEDMSVLLKKIDDAQEMGTEELSTAALTGSQGLKSLNKTLFSNYKYFKPELVGQLRKNLDGAEKLINSMIETKDPNLIADAAKIRDELFKTKITLRLADARIRAESIINKMAPGPDTATKAGTTIQELVFKALDDVRAEEKRLYQLIPGNTPITAPSTRNVLKDLIGKDGSLLKNELNELGIKPSGMSVLKKIRQGDDEIEETSEFFEAFDRSDNLVQNMFYRKIGYSPISEVGTPDVSNRFTIDKRMIESEYDLEQGSLDKLTLADLQTKNLKVLDGITFKETGDTIDPSIRTEMFEDLLNIHVESLNNLQRDYSKRGGAVNRGVAKLIGLQVKEFKKVDIAEGSTSVLDSEFLTLRDITNLRTQIFDTARTLATAGSTRSAGILNKIGNALTDDLGTKADAADGTEVTNLLKQAHSFSKSLNDTFSRGFPNTILKKQKTGRLNVLPELAINSVFQGGGDAVAYNYSGMESALTFLQKESGKQLDDSLTSKLGTLKGAQEDLLNVMFSEVVNQDTKRIDGDKLARFMSYAKGGYGKVLDRFPDLKKDLKNVETAQKLYDARKSYYGEVVQGVIKPGNMQAKKRLKNIFAFSDFLSADTNPGLVIANAIGEPNKRPGNPVNNLKRIIAFGKKSQNPDVIEGLKEVIFDRAFQYSRNEKDVIDFRAFKDYLVRPMVKGQPSVLEIMRTNGVIDSNEALRFSQIINRMITAQKSMPDDATKPVEGQLVKGAGAFVDLFARLIGSKVGSTLSSIIPGRGQGIIESAAGVRTIIGGLNIPTSLTQDLLLQSARDPKFFKMLVTKPKTEKEAVVTAKRVRAYLLNSGLGFIMRESEDDTVEFKKGAPPLPRQFDNTFLPMKQSSVEPSIQTGIPTTQVTSSQPFLSGLNTAPAGGGGSSAAPAQTDRTKYASLFPDDIVSGMIPTATMADGGEVQYMRNGGASMDMGLESSLSDQQTVQGGLDPYGDSGRDFVGPEKPMDPRSDIAKIRNQDSFKTQYMIDQIRKGNTTDIQYDKDGNLTGVYSREKPSMLESLKIDPLGSIMTALVPGAGLIKGIGDFFNTGPTYTGYNPKITTQENINDGNDYNPLIKIATDRMKPVMNKTAASLYNQNPDQYTLNVSGINSLRNR
jgi:hypothetical protein